MECNKHGECWICGTVSRCVVDMVQRCYIDLLSGLLVQCRWRWDRNCPVGWKRYFVTHRRIRQVRPISDVWRTVVTPPTTPTWTKPPVLTHYCHDRPPTRRSSWNTRGIQTTGRSTSSSRTTTTVWRYIDTRWRRALTVFAAGSGTHVVCMSGSCAGSGGIEEPTRWWVWLPLAHRSTAPATGRWSAVRRTRGAGTCVVTDCVIPAASNTTLSTRLRPPCLVSTTPATTRRLRRYSSSWTWMKERWASSLRAATSARHSEDSRGVSCTQSSAPSGVIVRSPWSTSAVLIVSSSFCFFASSLLSLVS